MHLVHLIFFVIKHFKTFPNHFEILIWNELGISSRNSSLPHTSVKIQQYLKCQNYDDGNFTSLEASKLWFLGVPSWGGNIKAQFSKSMKL
jgi:hypothetical protein